MKKRNLIILCFAFVFIVASFFLVNSVAPMSGIDIFEATFNADSRLDIVYLLSRAFSRSCYWNARVGEFLFFFFGPLPHIMYVITNTLFTSCFLYLIFKYAFDYEDCKKIDIMNFIFLLFILVAIIYLFEPNLWYNFFWMAGSCNHLWGLCILLLSFLPLRKFFLKTYKPSNIKIIFYCLFCFIAGTVSENIVPFIIGLTFLIIIYKYIKEKKFHLWSILLFISYLLGYVYLLFNYSTIYRYMMFRDNEWAIDTKNKFFIDFLYDFKIYIIIILILLIVYIFKIIYLKKIKNKNYEIGHSFYFNLTFYLLSFVSLFILIFSPYYVKYALFIISFSSLVLITYLIYEIFKNNNYILKIIIIVASIAIICYYTIHLFNKYQEYNKFSNSRDAFIKYQLDYGFEDELIVPISDFNLDIREFLSIETELCDNDIVRRKFNVPDYISINCISRYTFSTENML